MAMVEVILRVESVRVGLAGVLWCARKDVGEVSKLEVGGDVAA